MSEGIGDRYQRETKYRRNDLPRGGLDWASRPAPYKSYDGAPRFFLDPPGIEAGAPLWRTIHDRRSLRAYSGEPLSRAEAGQVLWGAQGVTAVGRGSAFRAAPSAGALYPVETYAALLNVEGFDPGLYHYDVRGHALEQIRKGDLRRELAAAALDQTFIIKAGLLLVWTALFERAKWKYRQRAYRYVYLDAGHIAQNAALAATSLGLGSCQIAALYDDEVNALLGVDGTAESVVYMTSIGRPAALTARRTDTS
jgi:SagB-type dehydrogenase family enzyme